MEVAILSEMAFLQVIEGDSAIFALVLSTHLHVLTQVSVGHSRAHKHRGTTYSRKAGVRLLLLREDHSGQVYLDQVRGVLEIMMCQFLIVVRVHERLCTYRVGGRIRIVVRKYGVDSLFLKYLLLLSKWHDKDHAVLVVDLKERLCRVFLDFLQVISRSLVGRLPLGARALDQRTRRL